MTTIGHHEAYVASLSALEELASLLDRAIERRDGSTLREYVEQREVAHRRAFDAEETPLDTEALATALASIRLLGRSPFSQLKGAAELLEAARNLSTAPRRVCKSAHRRMSGRAETLKNLVRCEAPPNILESQIQMTSDALLGLDGFDFLARVRANGEEEAPRSDDVLLPHCLECVRAPRTDPFGTFRAGGRGFVEAPEFYPKPRLVHGGDCGLAAFFRFGPMDRSPESGHRCRA